VPYPPPFSPFHFFLNWGLVGHLSELFLRNILRPSDVEDTWSLCRCFLVGFQVSAPYKRMVFTLQLNNQTLVFNEILAFQIDPIILNAVLAFPILIFKSLSDPPRLSTSLPS
jgi:hypothetical protein